MQQTVWHLSITGLMAWLLLLGAGCAGVRPTRPPAELFGSACATQGTVSLTDNYENGLSQWKEHGGCYNYSFTRVPAPGGTSGTAVRVLNRSWEDNRVCPGWESKRQSYGYKRRAELLPQNQDAWCAKYGEDFWIQDSIYVPANWPKQITADRVNVMQIIPIFGGQDGTDMKMNVLKNNRWNLEIRMESGSRKNIDLGPVRPGQWMNVVMRYKRSTGGDGAVQLWIDGKLAADYKGPTTYTKYECGTWKHGIYIGDDNGHTEYALYFDNTRIGQRTNPFGVCGIPGS